MGRLDGKLTLSDLKEMGLTAALIKLLPEPELVHRLGPPIKLWSKEVVEHVLATPEAKRLMEQAEVKRRAAAKSREARRKAEIERAINEIHIDKIGFRLLVRCSEEEAAELESMFPPQLKELLAKIDKLAPPNYDRYKDPVFIGFVLKRAFSYVLRYLAQFDTELFMAGIKDEECRKYRNAVIDKVVETYPELAVEGQRRKIMG